MKIFTSPDASQITNAGIPSPESITSLPFTPVFQVSSLDSPVHQSSPVVFNINPAFPTIPAELSHTMMFQSVDSRPRSRSASANPLVTDSNMSLTLPLCDDFSSSTPDARADIGLVDSLSNLDCHSRESSFVDSMVLPDVSSDTPSVTRARCSSLTIPGFEHSVSVSPQHLAYVSPSPMGVPPVYGQPLFLGAAVSSPSMGPDHGYTYTISREPSPMPSSSSGLFTFPLVQESSSGSFTFPLLQESSSGPFTLPLLQESSSGPFAFSMVQESSSGSSHSYPSLRPGDSESQLLSNDTINYYYSNLVACAHKVVQKARDDARDIGNPWVYNEHQYAGILIQKIEAHFQIWARESATRNDKMVLLETFIDIVREMCNLVASVSQFKRTILARLLQTFNQRTLPYLHREDFNAMGALDFQDVEKTRSLLLYIRLFKSLQLMRFGKVNAKLSNPELSADDSRFENPKVVRDRCKRMPSFSTLAHEYDAFLCSKIHSGELNIVDMYICKDHKTQSKKQKQSSKPRVPVGLLYYFVCPTKKAAEDFLRLTIRWCEDCDPKERKQRHEMFRKKNSILKDIRADKIQYMRLLESDAWTEDEVEELKRLFHVSLAIPDKKGANRTSTRS